MKSTRSQCTYHLRFDRVILILTFLMFVLFSANGWSKEKASSQDLTTTTDAHRINTTNIEHLKLLAEQGFAEAQHNLGVAYSNGKGVSKNLSEAVRWLERAALKGYMAAQCELAKAYNQGLGLQRDPVKAVAWWVLAARQDELGVKKDCGVSDVRLTKSEMERAIAYTKEWTKEIRKTGWGLSPTERIYLAGAAYREMFIKQSGFIPVEITVTFKSNWANRVEQLSFGKAEFRNGKMLITEHSFSFLDGVECRLDEGSVYRFTAEEWILVSE